MIFKEEDLHRKKEREDVKEAHRVQETAVGAKVFKNRNSLANVDPPLANEDSLNATFVEKQKTPLGEWITYLAEVKIMGHIRWMRNI